jgi:hypothetical protein
MAGNFPMIRPGLIRRGLALTVAAATLGAIAALPRQAAAAATLPRHVAPAAAVAGGLYGVACASATACVAVGGRSPTSTGPGASLAEKWNGTTWSVVTSPDPTGSTGARLAGVTCTSAKNCVAVGQYYTTSRTTLPAAEKWNGTKWSVITPAAPSGATAAELEAVACTSATNCWAAGVNSDATLTERWNGTKWSIVSSPSPNPAKPNVLSGIACPSASECWAVGYTFPGNFSGGLTEKWNGTKWSVVTTPSSASGEPIGDSCASTSACMAVGIGNNLFVLGQRWNGTKWVKATPANPSGATTSELNAVACPGAKSCESAGTYSTSSGSPTLGESWNGTKWAVQTMPAISGSTYASLQGISCTSASDCWAAGYSFNSSSVSSPVLEKWNGSSWKLS